MHTNLQNLNRDKKDIHIFILSACAVTMVLIGWWGGRRKLLFNSTKGGNPVFHLIWLSHSGSPELPDVNVTVSFLQCIQRHTTILPAAAKWSNSLRGLSHVVSKENVFYRITVTWTWMIHVAATGGGSNFRFLSLLGFCVRGFQETPQFTFSGGFLWGEPKPPSQSVLQLPFGPFGAPLDISTKEKEWNT